MISVWDVACTFMVFLELAKYDPLISVYDVAYKFLICTYDAWYEFNLFLLYLSVTADNECASSNEESKVWSWCRKYKTLLFCGDKWSKVGITREHLQGKNYI